MLPPQHRLRRSDDYRSVFRTGKRAGGRYVVAHVLPVSTRSTRVGFVVSKAIGNAVVRNRVKRRLRSVAAELLGRPGGIACDADIALRALPRAADATFGQLRDDVHKNLERLGVVQ